MLLFKDDVFKFYIEPTDNPDVISLAIFDAYDGFVFGYNLENTLEQTVFHGKSGTYEYYKVTFKCNNIGRELVLIEMSENILKPVYLDDVSVDLSRTRLWITTKRGGLSVKRIEKG